MLTVKDKQRRAFAISESFAPLRDLEFARPAGNPNAANGARTLVRREGELFGIQRGSWEKWLGKISW